MNTGTLHAVRAEDPLTAAEAVAWFAAPTPTGRQVLGYTFSARAATWVTVRADGTVDDAQGPADVLADAYEMVFFDGDRELRWLRTPQGRGPAVALGEDPDQLPAGRDVTADPPPQRGMTLTRLLAGVARAHATPGWTTLRSERYTAAHLPATCTAEEVLTIQTVEYVSEDGHGNRDVVDTRTVGLRTRPRAALRAAHPGPERTTP